MIVDKVARTLPIHQGFSQLPLAVFIGSKIYLAACTTWRKSRTAERGRVTS